MTLPGERRWRRPRKARATLRPERGRRRGIRFPYWGERFGWRSSGRGSTGSRGELPDGLLQRRSRPHGRLRDRRGQSGSRGAGAGREEWRAGTLYRLGRARGAEVVTWKRGGHLCIVAGRGVSGSTLLALASWHEPAADRLLPSGTSLSPPPNRPGPGRIHGPAASSGSAAATPPRGADTPRGARDEQERSLRHGPGPDAGHGDGRPGGGARGGGARASGATPS